MKNKIVFIIMLISILFITLIPNFSIADIEEESSSTSTTQSTNPIENPGGYNPGEISDEDVKLITGKVNPIFGIISTVGIAISVITLAILGIKYMIGSVEERADYKKSAIPYLIGCVLLLATSTFIGIIAKLVENIEL